MCQAKESQIISEFNEAKTQIFALRHDLSKIKKENQTLRVDMLRPRNVSIDTKEVVVGESRDDNLIDTLRSQVMFLEAECKRLSEHNQLVQVDTEDPLRDEETSMNRILHQVDVGNRRIIDQLNGQVDFLNEQLALRESELQDVVTKLRNQSQLDIIVEDLKRKPELANSLVIDPNVIKSLEEEIKTLKESRLSDDHFQNIVQSLMSQLSACNSELDDLSKQLELKSLEQFQKDAIIAELQTELVNKSEFNAQLQSCLDQSRRDLQLNQKAFSDFRDHSSIDLDNENQTTATLRSQLLESLDKTNRLEGQLESLKLTTNVTSATIPQQDSLSDLHSSKLIISLQSQLSQANFDLMNSESKLKATENKIDYMVGTIDEHQHEILMKENEIIQKRKDIALLQDQLRHSQSALTDATAESFHNTQTLQFLLQTLRARETEFSSLLGKFNSLRDEKVISEQLCSELQDKVNNLVKQIVFQNEEYVQSNQKIVESDKNCQQLKTLLSQMESSARLQADRLVKVCSCLDEKERELVYRETEIRQIKQIFHEKDSLINEKEGIIESMTANIQELHRVFDTFSNNESIYKSQISKLDSKVASLQDSIEKSESISKSACDKFNESKTEIRHLHSRCASLSEENEELKNLLKRKNEETSEVSEDLRLLGQENQVLTAELADITNERDDILAHIQVLAQNLAITQHTVQSLELERNDLTASLHKNSIEKKVLRDEVEELR